MVGGGVGQPVPRPRSGMGVVTSGDVAKSGLASIVVANTVLQTLVHQLHRPIIYRVYRLLHNYVMPSPVVQAAHAYVDHAMYTPPLTPPQI